MTIATLLFAALFVMGSSIDMVAAFQISQCTQSLNQLSAGYSCSLTNLVAQRNTTGMLYVCAWQLNGVCVIDPCVNAVTSTDCMTSYGTQCAWLPDQGNAGYCIHRDKLCPVLTISQCSNFGPFCAVGTNDQMQTVCQFQVPSLAPTDSAPPVSAVCPALNPIVIVALVLMAVTLIAGIVVVAVVVVRNQQKADEEDSRAEAAAAAEAEANRNRRRL